MNLLNAAASAALCSGLLACVTTTPQGEAVRVTTNPEAVRGCVFIANVEGRESGWGGVGGQNIAESNAHALLRENAAAGGADTVLLMTSNVGFSGAVQRGDAYRCRHGAGGPILQERPGPSGAQSSVKVSLWEAVAGSSTAAILQAPYDFSPPVRARANAWAVREGQRLLVTGAVGDSHSGFLQVVDGPRIGYVRKSTVILYRNGYAATEKEAELGLDALSNAAKSRMATQIGIREFVIFGVYPGRPDSSGGVGAVVVYRLLGTRSARYIFFEITPFNSAGTAVADSTTAESMKRLQVTGPIDPRPIAGDGDANVASWRSVWTNATIECLHVDSAEVEYMDGSRDSFTSNVDTVLYPELSNSCASDRE